MFNHEILTGKHVRIREESGNYHASALTYHRGAWLISKLDFWIKWRLISTSVRNVVLNKYKSVFLIGCFVSIRICLSSFLGQFDINCTLLVTSAEKHFGKESFNRNLWVGNYVNVAYEGCMSFTRPSSLHSVFCWTVAFTTFFLENFLRCLEFSSNCITYYQTLVFAVNDFSTHELVVPC